MLRKLASKALRVVRGGQGPAAAYAPFRDARARAVSHSTAQVEAYYHDNTQAYLRGFGEVFQGSRPESTEQLIDYLIAAADLQDGQSVLDAGCGVGGPALAFAECLAVDIEGVTLAQVQVDAARDRIADTELKGSVAVRQGDFHHLPAMFPDRRFDRILMLESLCHAEDYRAVLAGARQLLKPGGRLYIKDFYAVDYRSQPERLAGQGADLQRLSDIYRLAVPDLVSQLDLVLEMGFQLIYLRMPEFAPSYTHWGRYEMQTGRPWNPQSGAPGEVIQGFELLVTAN